MNTQNKRGLTLVELVIVAAILSILSTIGFVNYSSYLSSIRDTNRTSQLKEIGNSLNVYKTRNSSLPIPNDKIDITTNGTNIIAYQGYAGKNIIKKIGYTSEGKDPKDNTYFSYYLTKNKKYFQLMALLEEEPEATTKLELLDNKTYSIDYELKYPYVEGDNLGILTTSTNEPIQNLLTTINLSSAPTGTIAHLSNTQTESGAILSNLEGIAKLGGKLHNAKGKNCKEILDKYGTIIPDGNYKLLINGDYLDVYCDMTNDGGGWTLVANIKQSSQQAHWNVNSVNIEDYVNLDNENTQKLSDILINKIKYYDDSNIIGYRMTCWEGTSYRQTMYCSSKCNFSSTNSVLTSECSRCTGTYNPSTIIQMSPNYGTKGLGHHHNGVSWSMAYQRHPEEGNNYGCKSDSRGSGDGFLWVK